MNKGINSGLISFSTQYLTNYYPDRVFKTREAYGFGITSFDIGLLSVGMPGGMDSFLESKEQRHGFSRDKRWFIS